MTETNEHDAQIARYEFETQKFAERQKTARCVVYAAVWMAGMVIFSNLSLRLKSLDWLQYAAPALAVLLAGAGVNRIVVNINSRNVQKCNSRTAELEKMLDPNRTSSVPKLPRGAGEQESP